MSVRDLKGRLIEDVPFSGLVESYCKIALMCETAKANSEHMTVADLHSIIQQILEATADGLIFSGADKDEINYVTNYLMEGMNVSRSGIH